MIAWKTNQKVRDLNFNFMFNADDSGGEGWELVQEMFLVGELGPIPSICAFISTLDIYVWLEYLSNMALVLRKRLLF